MLGLGFKIGNAEVESLNQFKQQRHKWAQIIANVASSQYGGVLLTVWMSYWHLMQQELRKAFSRCKSLD